MPSCAEFQSVKLPTFTPVLEFIGEERAILQVKTKIPTLSSNLAGRECKICCIDQVTRPNPCVLSFSLARGQAEQPPNGPWLQTGDGRTTRQRGSSRQLPGRSGCEFVRAAGSLWSETGGERASEMSADEVCDRCEAAAHLSSLYEHPQGLT